MNLDAFSDKRLRSQILAAAELQQIGSEARFSSATGRTNEGAEPLRQILVSLRRHSWFILKITVLGAILAVLASLFLQPTYLATSQLIVDIRRTPQAVATPIEGLFSAAAEDSAIDTHIASLLSDSHLRQTLIALGDADASKPVSDETSNNAEKTALARLRKNLIVRQERRSKIIGVAYRDRDPVQAAHVANTVSELYVKFLRDAARRDAERAVARLTKRLAEVPMEVAAAESEVQSYRQNNVANEVARPDETEQQIIQTARQLALAKSNLAATRDRLEQYRQQGHGSTADTAKSLDSPRLLQLADMETRQVNGKSISTDLQSQDLKRAIETEITAGVSRIESEERTYQSQIETVSARLTLLRQAALRALERKSVALSQLYDSLLRERQDLVERSGFSEPEIRILAAARPPLHPASVSRIYIIPPAIMSFALLGCMISIVRDRLDHTLHGERETTAALQIRCAGMVPELPQQEVVSLLSVLRDNPRRPYAKAIRSIFATTMPVTAANREQKIVLLTSSAPAESKTVLAWSLAVTAANLHWRVLLLEVGGGHTSPLRSEMLSTVEHSAAPTQIANPSNTQQPVAAATRFIRKFGVFHLPLSNDENDVLSPLADPQFPALLEQLRETYDLVVIDAPSVLDCTEVRLLAAKADKVLFAVRWGHTRKQTAQTALRLLEMSDCQDQISTEKFAYILTRVNLNEHLRYHFADQGDLLVSSKN